MYYLFKMFFCKNCKKNIGQNIIYMMMDNSFCSEKCRLKYLNNSRYQEENFDTLKKNETINRNGSIDSCAIQ